MNSGYILRIGNCPEEKQTSVFLRNYDVFIKTESVKKGTCKTFVLGNMLQKYFRNYKKQQLTS